MEFVSEKKMVDSGHPIVGYLCIPKIHQSVRRDFIFKKLCALRVGFIQKLVEIPLKTNPNFKRVLIRVLWNQEPRTLMIRDRICNGNPVYFVYEDPWFWKIVAGQSGSCGGGIGLICDNHISHI